jgi:hypothetical protein
MLRVPTGTAEPGPDRTGPVVPLAAPPQALARLASRVGNAAFTRLVARQPAPRAPAAPAAPVQRTNLVFIMGEDRHGRRANHFYTLAREYASRWGATIVDEDRYRTLAGIFAYLRARPDLRVGTSTSSPTRPRTATCASRSTSTTATGG